MESKKLARRAIERIRVSRRRAARANSFGMMNHVTSCLGDTVDQLPSGDYQASGDWNGLVGAKLNGDWEIRVADLWPVDNGYIFSWSIAFDPMIVQDCSSPPIQ